MDAASITAECDVVGELVDLIAEGEIQAVLMYSPDRLSRKYAYQVLLTEEFTWHGTGHELARLPDRTPRQPVLISR